ncbi:MAG: hypothetical protein HY960_06430 [Ignavibacteriae bacterium]|nr:hypothetical protein [Ignavibacteriota bacterium]
MKHLTLAMIMLLVLTLVALSQPGGKQPLPNFVGNPETTATNIFGKGWGLGKFTGGVQGVRSAMLHGPHDFTPDSGKVFERDSLGLDTLGNTIWDTVYGGGTRNKRLCSFCHTIHVSKDANPLVLWNRTSQAGKTFGKYENPSSMDAEVYDPGTTAAGFKDNFSSYCLSCHDGSVGIFSPTAYQGGGTTGDVSHVPHGATIGASGTWTDMAHTHPVNFDYNAVQAVVPEELYPAVDPVSAVWKGYSGTNGSGGNYTTVRLFNGTMQCSSCHNPHMSSGIGTVITSDYGRRCVACHKK